MNTFPALVDFDISGTEGPIAGFPGAFSAYGAAARGGAAIVFVGDGITVVLNGFPSFLQDRSYGYWKKQGSLN